MTYKNWDSVRDYRIYGYLNQSEKDIFDKAVATTGLQQATCVRQFVMGFAKKLLAENTSQKEQAAGENCPYSHPNFTAI